MLLSGQKPGKQGTDKLLVHFHGAGRFGKSGLTVLQNCYKFSFSESSQLVEFCPSTGIPLGRPLKCIRDDFFLYMEDFVLLIGKRYVNDSLIDFF